MTCRSIFVAILLVVQGVYGLRYTDQDAPVLQGVTALMPPLGAEDKQLDGILSAHNKGAILNVKDHAIVFTDTDNMTKFVADSSGHGNSDASFSSWDKLQECAFNPECLDAWGTSPHIHGKNITVVRVLQRVPVRNLVRCHVYSTEDKAFCHLRDGYFELGWGYYALAVTPDSERQFTLGVMCHAWDDSVSDALNVSSFHTISCHYSNGKAFYAPDKFIV
eukprot:CAMPEP_0203762326 /NCGR_PEP_ID=MMETSP0098-20131031/15247_1 /ASSEMBLY_ACC=CAM_ASM_000208 /TAXON_ID=96639 /ORGANISM=" , Strain NY0313808BC1" /LENGTH=219 /DNA_ID=CAMNT_0050656705 /DNA_START=683 /DNA_END=1342 /DNA_ORIENTATION=-